MSPALLLLAAVPAAPPANADISVPPGFSVKLIADNAIAPDIYTMTIDEAGRVLVAGRGYVRVLVDDNGDGIADRAVDLIDGLKEGPMGLFAEGESLYVVVDGGLHRYRGYDGKRKLTEKDRDTLIKLKTTGEHDAHAVRRGPDGWLYLLCGNMAGVNAKTITSPRSPVKEPVAGTLLRISPDEKEVEVVADGFRNAYSFDFNLDGEPFTYDSDNERCVGLPWYEPCRFYHVVPGGNYGWRSPQLGQFWRKPPYFVDCVPPVCYLGRGSPTGVACYRHTHFPEKYRGGFFLADWTFGRIHYVPLTAKHSSYEGKPEVFAEAIGTSGFAPTSLVVHPKTGELFVSIGGRGTRGGVYRISHDKSPAGKPLEIAKRSLEWTADDAKRWQTDCLSNDARLRRNTLELMARAGVKLGWSPKLKDAVKPNLSHPDPLVRMAAARTLKPLIVPIGVSFDAQARLTLALLEVKETPEESFKTALAILIDGERERAGKGNAPQITDDMRLQALRIIQLALGDLGDAKSIGTAFEGYSLRGEATPEQRLGLETVGNEIFSRSRNTLVLSELFRTLAAMRSEDQRFTRRPLYNNLPESDVIADIGALVTVARMPANYFAVSDIANVLVNLDRKVAEQKIPRDTFWPLRLTEVVTRLGTLYPALADEVLQHSEFGRPEHLLFVKPLKIPSKEAIKRFLLYAATAPNFTWTPGLVELLGSLPDEERRRLLLRLWNRAELREAILKVLPPKDDDRSKFLGGLASFDPEVVRASARSLLELPPGDADDLVAMMRALRRLEPEDKATRVAVIALLRRHTGEEAVDPTYKGWAEWLTKNHSEAAKLLAAHDGFDAAAWKKREAGIPWDRGDAERGRAVFTKASCAACHDGGKALGPSLLGITKRFGRDDLLTAILQPGKDVSARYRPVRITTTDEKIYIGMLIYEATDGVILQTTADTAVRIVGANIASKRPVEASIMPAGLLDKLTDAEIADLLAYMKTLEEPKPK